MKISVITACFNSAGTLPTAMESVLAQQGVAVEYIVIDGGSADGTADLLRAYEGKFAATGRIAFRWLSERDSGMYDAINKGIGLATGDVVGILNADDILSADDTLAKIGAAFGEDVEALYADVRFVRKEMGTVRALRAARTVRYCSAAKWRPWMFRFAVMVPHPSFYVRRACFLRLGGYSLDYRICADFELELRFLLLARLKAVYLPECVVVMRMGGASTAGWWSNVEINREDLLALRTHGIWSCLPLIYLKYFFKIWGFVFKRSRKS